MSGFQVYSAESTDGSNKGTIDFDALNKYVVETADLEGGDTLTGYISGIYDLGTQILPDAEYNVDKGDESLTIEQLTTKYTKEIESGKINEFKSVYDNDVKANVIKKLVPQPNRQAVCYSVDFPEIMLDKAPFFGGESDPKPLRMYYGGEWWNKPTQKMIINSVIPLKKTKDDKLGWTMHPLSQLYKMAVASKVITNKQAFQPEMIDKLLGKSLQFKAQVFFEEKNGGTYYKEKLNFVGALARGQKEYEDVNTSLIMFHAENDVNDLKELRNHVINTMARATNFEGSPLQAQLIAAGRYKPTESSEEEEVTAESIMDAANNSETADEDNFGF